ncbi:MAG: hypothetical protein ABUK16_01715 [Anaerolineales bacterium]
MRKRIKPIFENSMNMMLPMAVVPVRVDAEYGSLEWVLISTALTIIPLALTFFLLH